MDQLQNTFGTATGLSSEQLKAQLERTRDELAFREYELTVGKISKDVEEDQSRVNQSINIIRHPESTAWHRTKSAVKLVGQETQLATGRLFLYLHRNGLIREKHGSLLADASMLFLTCAPTMAYGLTRGIGRALAEVSHRNIGLKKPPLPVLPEHETVPYTQSFAELAAQFEQEKIHANDRSQATEVAVSQQDLEVARQQWRSGRAAFEDSRASSQVLEQDR